MMRANNFALEENEAPIANLLNRNPDTDIQPLVFNSKFTRRGEKTWNGVVFDSRLVGALRILPTDDMRAINLKEVGLAYANKEKSL